MAHIPFLATRGRYSSLAKNFPTDAKRFTEEALKLADEAALKYADNPKKLADFKNKQRSRISEIARDIERMVPETTAEFETAGRRLLAGRATPEDEQLIEAFMRETFDKGNVEFRLSGKEEVRFQSVKKQIMETPKGVSPEDWTFAKDVVIQQKKAMLAKAWERYTADWTQAQHEWWDRLEVRLDELLDARDKNSTTPVRWPKGTVPSVLEKDWGSRSNFNFFEGPDHSERNSKVSAFWTFVRHWGEGKKKGLSPGDRERFKELDALDKRMYQHAKAQQQAAYRGRLREFVRERGETPKKQENRLLDERHKAEMEKQRAELTPEEIEKRRRGAAESRAWLEEMRRDAAEKLKKLRGEEEE
jgi:hypothetical protein